MKLTSKYCGMVQHTTGESCVQMWYILMKVGGMFVSS